MAESSSAEEAALIVRKCVNKLSAKPRYQRFLIIFLSCLWTQITYSSMIGSYVFMNPLFECGGQS